MSRDSITDPQPGEGKTYSLFGYERDTNAYYNRIRLLVDGLIKDDADLHHLVESVREESKSRRYLKKLALRVSDGSTEASLARMLREQFSQYTRNATSHLQGLSLTRRWDRVLSISEGQYHFHMLEVELVNRLNAAEFRTCGMRLAFLPHCLHDIAVTCQSVIRGHDHVCKGCSKDCALNAVSRLLRRHKVAPYIWMTANLRSLLRQLRKEGQTVGVLGIACIPELVRGMRLCMRARVPVIGVPLDANRCARWWGQFYPNSVNVQELERLLVQTESNPGPA